MELIADPNILVAAICEMKCAGSAFERTRSRKDKARHERASINLPA